MKKDPPPLPKKKPVKARLQRKHLLPSFNRIIDEYRDGKKVKNSL